MNSIAECDLKRNTDCGTFDIQAWVCVGGGGGGGGGGEVHPISVLELIYKSTSVT